MRMCCGPRATAVVALAWLVGCGDAGGFPDAMLPEAPLPGGTFSLRWDLVDTAGEPVTCDRVGGITVTMLLRNRAVQGGTTEVFTCGTGSGTTPAITPGTYDIQFELTGATGLIATAPAQEGLLVASGQDTPLAPVRFEIEATGGLALELDALQAGGNCADVASNGAGISAMSITLEHTADRACEPATLMIGTTPYTVNCATPTEVGCIDATTAVTAMALPSDSYQIHIRARQGMNPQPCFTNDDLIRVPPNGMTFQRTLNLAPTGAPGCL